MVDETPLYFDMVSSRTFEKKGKKEIRVKSTGAVVLACTCAGKMLAAFCDNFQRLNIQFDDASNVYVLCMHVGKTTRVPKGLTAPSGFILAQDGSRRYG